MNLVFFFTTAYFDCLPGWEPPKHALFNTILTYLAQFNKIQHNS
jgi:hypothetical protein